MIFRKIFHRNEDGEHNFWMSYTDLMSGFLVVFIIISAVMYNNYQDKTRESNASLKNLIVEYKDIFYLDDPNISVEFNSDRGSIILTHHNPQKYLFASGKDTMEVVLERYLYNIRKPLVVKTMELWKEHNYKNVELRIEGHTDPNGLYRGTKRGSDESFLQNLDLSSRRANRVYNYILGNKSLTVEQREFAKKNMISVGYSFAHRVQQNNVGDEKLDPSSRRIEFRIPSADADLKLVLIGILTSILDGLENNLIPIEKTSFDVLVNNEGLEIIETDYLILNDIFKIKNNYLFF